MRRNGANLYDVRPRDESAAATKPRRPEARTNPHDTTKHPSMTHDPHPMPIALSRRRRHVVLGAALLAVGGWGLTGARRSGATPKPAGGPVTIVPFTDAGVRQAPVSVAKV